MIKLIDLECLRPITFLCVLIGHAPPEQISLCTSHSNKFRNASLRSQKRSSLMYSRLLSVAVIAWSSYQFIISVMKMGVYSYCCLIVMFTVPQLVMFAKLWLKGGNHEMQEIFSKLTEIDYLLHMTLRTGGVQIFIIWVKRTYRYAAFIVVFYFLNSFVYVYTILQFGSSIKDGLIIITLHSMSNVLLLEFLSIASLLRNRFDVLNSLISLVTGVHKKGRFKSFVLKKDLGQLRHRLSRSWKIAFKPEGGWSKMPNTKSRRILSAMQLDSTDRNSKVVNCELEDTYNKSGCSSGLSRELRSVQHMKDSAPTTPYSVVSDTQGSLCDCDLQTHIQKLRLAHHILHEVSNLINRRYSMLLLSEICTVFVVLVVCAHVVFNYHNIDYLKGPHTIFYMLVWIAVTTTRVVVVIFTCRGVSEEATRTVHLVTTPHVGPGDQSLWDAFSLQLVHFGGVQFDAGGVFQLRLQLLFSIVGATATYLIVLQQYNDIKI